jgi:membrane protein implicated in regulation of membrane protease activity
MSVGRMVAIAIGGLILALITGLITKNVIIAILFPVLLIGFLLMWRRIKEETPSKPKEEEEKVSVVQEEVEVEDSGD